MKKIECYIQPYNLDTVAEALAVEGVVGMSVAEVKGFGVQKGFTRGEDVKPGEFRFHPKMKVEMVVLEKDVEPHRRRHHDVAQEQPDRRGQDLRAPDRRRRPHAHRRARRRRHQVAAVRPEAAARADPTRPAATWRPASSASGAGGTAWAGAGRRPRPRPCEVPAVRRTAPEPQGPGAAGRCRAAPRRVRRGRPRQTRSNSRSKSRLGARPDDLLGRLAVLEQDDRRDAHDAELGRDAGFSSTLTLPTATLSPCSSAISSMIGPTMRQGRTTAPRNRRSSASAPAHFASNVASVRVFTSAATWTPPCRGGSPLCGVLSLAPTDSRARGRAAPVPRRRSGRADRCPPSPSCPAFTATRCPRVSYTTRCTAESRGRSTQGSCATRVAARG